MVCKGRHCLIKLMPMVLLLCLQVSEANIARAAAEARQLELERANSQLRLEVATSQATSKSTMEEAVRLLSECLALFLVFGI